MLDLGELERASCGVGELRFRSLESAFGFRLSEHARYFNSSPVLFTGYPDISAGCCTLFFDSAGMRPS